MNRGTAVNNSHLNSVYFFGSFVKSNVLLLSAMIPSGLVIQRGAVSGYTTPNTYPGMQVGSS